MRDPRRARTRASRNVPTCAELLESRRLLSGYTVTDLANMGLSQATDVNELGQVAGVANGHAALWQNGATADLGTLGGATSIANDVNNLGQVVGSSSDGYATPAVAVRWQDGVIHDLGLGQDSQAAAINDAGQIVGTASGHAFLWQDGVVTWLGGLDGSADPGGAASAINEAGRVAGSSYNGQAGALGLPVIHTFGWRAGVMIDVGTPAYTVSSFPAAINSSGQIAGSTTVYVNTGYGAAFLSRGFLYDGQTMTQLPLPGLQSLATDLNDSGQVVGTADKNAFLYQDGIVTDLNTLVPAGTPHLAGATGINNAGQIVGYFAGGRPFLLTPAPAISGPKVEISVDGTEVDPGVGTVNFGDTPTGVPVTRWFTVRNAGGAPLDLTSPVTLRAGYALVSAPAATSLAPGAATSFVVTQDATAAGDYAGVMSLSTNDPYAGTCHVALGGTVDAARVIDDGSGAFHTTGVLPTPLSGLGFGGDERLLAAAPHNPSLRRALPRLLATAAWSFADLSPGTYRVSATWTAAATRAPDAPFTINDGTNVLKTASVNQRSSPDDFIAHGVAWEDLGVVTVAGGTLSVRVTNQARGRVAADAVRVEQVVATAAPPLPDSVPAVLATRPPAAPLRRAGVWDALPTDPVAA